MFIGFRSKKKKKHKLQIIFQGAGGDNKKSASKHFSEYD